MRPDSLPSCLRLLRLLREPHTVACLAGQMGVSVKTIRREIVRLRSIGFVIEAKIHDEFGAKSYRVIHPQKTFAAILAE